MVWSWNIQCVPQEVKSSGLLPSSQENNRNVCVGPSDAENPQKAKVWSCCEKVQMLLQYEKAVTKQYLLFPLTRLENHLGT